jgi:3-deoxy-D-manno-octulosonic-acid transferase
MPRFFYSIAILALLPWALLHLLWRSRRQPDYLKNWAERFGLYPSPRSPGPLLWIHAVSVGETRAAQPLIAALRERHPGYRILMTHMTPTGRQTGEALYGDTIERVFLPYDTPWAVAAFLNHFRPALGLIVETEIWPNLIAACRSRDLPVLLVNARLSEKSARGYARFPRLTRDALQGLSGITAIGKDDAARLNSLGASGVAITGSVKFDISPPAQQLALGQALRERFAGRPCLVCASTRDGEEAAILDAWITARPRDALLILIPRHPQRFGEVATLCDERRLRLQRRSENCAVLPDTDVWLGDSMGEMFAYYAAADVAFIGGSLLPFGSQNLIEACAVGTPLLIGPSVFNFPDIARDAVACGAAQPIGTAPELVAVAKELLVSPIRRELMRSAGLAFAARHRGATAKTLELIERFIPAAN